MPKDFKPRGSYRKYLYNPTFKIPRSTLFCQNKTINDIFQAPRPDNNNLIENQNSNESITATLAPFYFTEIDDRPNNGDDTQTISLNNSLDEESEIQGSHDNYTDDHLYEEPDLLTDLSKAFDSSEEITANDLAAGYLAAFFNGKTSQASLTDYLILSNITSTTKLPTTFDGLIKNLIGKNNTLNYTKSWYCPICMTSHSKIDCRQRQCKKCETRLNMYYFLDIEEQIRRLLHKFNHSKIKEFASKPTRPSEEKALHNFFDGELYQELLKSEDGDLFQKKEAFTFILNTDGASICKKSKLTIWPVYLVINKLPDDMKYSLENIILVGLSIGDYKPYFDVFLSPIVIKIKKLELGINVCFEDVTKEIKFFVVSAVFDKPAKAAFLNMISSYGHYGCTKCLQPGRSFKTNFEKRGQSHIYPFIANDPQGPLRSEQSYENDLKEVLNSKAEHVNGVKGPCALSYLKYFHPTSSTIIDYMHSLCEGVFKNFFRFWFDIGDFLGPHSLRKYMQEIDKRVLLIKPPLFVPSTPRSIYTHTVWRAHEYLTFFLYYALPVFKNLMEDKYYQNLKKLVVFTETILSPTIKLSDLIKINKVIVDFVEELEFLYTPKIMLSGVHELLHLVDCTIRFGPLNGCNCFQFEEINRKMLRFIHGFDLIGEEMIKIFSTAQFLSSYSLNVKSSLLRTFILSRLRFKTPNTKKLSIKLSDAVVAVKAKPRTSVNVQYLEAINKFTGQKLEQILTSVKLSLNGIIFSTHLINTKRSESCFYTDSNKIGKIECFFFLNDRIYVLYRQLVKLFNPFFSPICSEIRSKMSICYDSNQLLVEELHNIKKAFLIDLSKNECYVSLFSMSHLFC